MNTPATLLRPFAALLALLLTGVALHADEVAISFEAGQLYNVSGDLLPAGNLVLLIADTADNGFGPLMPGSTLNVGDFLNGDDQIIGSTTILDNGLGEIRSAVTSLTLTSAPYTTLTSGDPLALVWFSTVTGESTVLSAGDSYGEFSSTSLTVDGDPWVVPSAGSTIDIDFTTLDVGGTHAETEAYATLTVAAIPEPAATAAFAALGALVLVAWRRRRRV